MKKKNISKIQNCYGCGVCALACGKHLIDIRLNNDGFYEPYINNLSACINCGLCVEVCAFSHEECANSLAYPIESYGAWSKNLQIQRECSSGGVGYEIAKFALNSGYKICAVKYNIEEKRAEHYIATSLDELEASKGSKYIQSYTVGGFSKINRREKTVVFGTPCQIDSLRRYIHKFKVEDNFILVDFFCHGVPSLHAWHKYLDAITKDIGTPNEVTWRDKETGWHDSWVMKIIGQKSQYSSWWSKGDTFYRLFLGDYCSNQACQKNCKYKYNRSSADIRIGDAWGNEYKNNEDGVSALIAFTEKGKNILEQLKETCTLETKPFFVVAEGQMKHNAGKAWIAPIVKRVINSSVNISSRFWNNLFFIDSLPKRIKGKIKSMKYNALGSSNKRIGIMTMHKVINSGSALQAFALQKKLEQLGFNSEIIDYKFPNAAHVKVGKIQRIIDEYAPQWLQYLNQIRCLRSVPDDKIRFIRFTEFYKKNLKLSRHSYPSVRSLEKNPPKYDLYMTGSDQVWNPQHIKNDASFLFSFLKGKEPRVSYAASFTTSELPDKVFPVFAKLLPKYSSVTVREASGIPLASKLGANDPQLVCDPTLLITKEVYSKIAEQSQIKPKGKYILAYILTYAYNPYPQIRQIVDDVKRIFDLPVIFIQSHHDEDKVDTVINDEGPCEFLWLFEHAEFIITTSFHGTAFALNFEKPFYSIVRSETSTDSRMVSLLQQVHRTDSILVYDKDRVKEIKPQQTTDNPYLDAFRKSSIEILKEMVQHNI